MTRLTTLALRDDAELIERARPRLALFAQDLAGGGAERMMVNIANELAAGDCNVDLVLVRRTGPYLKLVSPRVRIVELGTKRVSRSIPALIRYLRSARPEALLSTLMHVNAAAIIGVRLARTPTRIVMREANYATRFRKIADNTLERIAYYALPLLARLADDIVAVSTSVADDLARAAWLPRARVTTVRNPVITKELLARASATIEHPWLAGAGPMVIAVGRLSIEKDYGNLLRAFRLVRNEMQARLTILGEGGMRADLEALVRDLGLHEDVRLLGFVDNPHAWMRAASAFVLSSSSEGSPNALVEAMACGVPVIATDCPGGCSEILESGRFGKLVPVGDSPRLARAIIETLSGRPDTSAAERRAAEYRADVAARSYARVMLGRDL